jgi:hypothetical protein
MPLPALRRMAAPAERSPRASDLVETAAGRDEAARDPQRLDGAMLLDRGYAGPVRPDAAGDLDLARRAARLDAQPDGGKADDLALDQ